MELVKALDEVFDGETTAPVADPAPAPEPQPEPAPVEPAPEPQIEPQAPVPTPEEPKDHSVPLAKYLDTRDELKEYKRKVEAYEASQRQQAPQAIPDPFDDPQGFAAHQQQMVASQVAEVRFQLSDQMARQVHGEDAVTASIEWAGEKAKADPLFAASYMQQPNPIDWIVRQHKRDATLSQIGDRPIDDFVKDYITRNPALLGAIAPQAVAPAIPAVAAIPQQAPPVAPPRSLVDAPSTGGVDHVPMGLNAAIGAAFPR